MTALRPIIRQSYVDDFYRTAASIFGWEDMDDQVVMDIGCGQGNSSKTFATMFPEIRRLVAIDIVPERLNEATESNSHPKVEYIQGDITNKITLDNWIGGIDVAISIFCFNCLTEQRLGFENLYRLLRPMGQAAILQSLDSNYYDLIKNLSVLPNWSEYTDTLEPLIPESRYKKYTAVHYRKLFEEIGFEVVACTDEMKTHTYTSDAECRDAIFQSCPLNSVIPEERKMEFMTDLFETFSKNNPRNDDGLLYMTYGTLSALLRKPEDFEDSGESEA